ncbi:MAG: C39 family peptidase [Candidatus Liptonbacteria bacterium]|nr:C39 family peptidase [Candidatus Liptonbacteria bacterium]
MPTRALIATLTLLVLLAGGGFLIWGIFSWATAPRTAELAPPPAGRLAAPAPAAPLPQFASTSTKPLGPVAYNTTKGNTYSFAQASIRAARRLLERDSYLPSSKETAFDAAMETAVKEYQKAHDLAVTGAIGSLARLMMNKEIRAGKKLPPDPDLRMSRIVPASSTAYMELPIPLIEQEYSLSCEAASLQMALAHKGVRKSQDEVLAAIGVAEPKVKYKNAKGEYVWGDPNKGFVGDVRGWMYGLKSGMVTATGWGVNRAPIARAAKELRPESEGKSGGALENITKELAAGNPVIVWYYQYLPEELLTLKSYLTPRGARIPFMPTHVALLVGYKRTPEGTTVLLVNDPEDGRREMAASTFLAAWAKYGYDMVVVR